eukprot:CAMPEP_0184867500 /NCGR_PEP_ID=MMETSP0580-20130426/26847_1 /TAXON_ID=1118495 /ORGANISM="Dactyliosolen fragilissimus" /LENGTH=64 /DNA_ID=CAMNT_0027367831 /DNA_START=188 /DNA_END=382 /DNA_ORIENTATION=+
MKRIRIRQQQEQKDIPTKKSTKEEKALRRRNKIENMERKRVKTPMEINGGQGHRLGSTAALALQ